MKFSRGVRLCANNVKLTLLHQPAVTRLCANNVKLTPLDQPAVTPLCADNMKLTLLHQPAVTRLCADKVKLTPLHQPAVNHQCYQGSKCMALESSIRQTGNLQTLLHNFCLTEMTCSWHKNQKHATSLQ